MRLTVGDWFITNETQLFFQNSARHLYSFKPARILHVDVLDRVVMSNFRNSENPIANNYIAIFSHEIDSERTELLQSFLDGGIGDV